jgi:predicted tellurium resistance membrane protein TerC
MISRNEEMEYGHLLLSLLTLLFLEVVLGIDNLIFITIASSQLPEHLRPKARVIGLCLALVLRLLLLSFVSYLADLTHPFINYHSIHISLRDILLTFGGLFLIYKATSEIHAEFLPEDEKQTSTSAKFFMVILQIGMLDLIFSFDSIMTAIGMVQEFYIMVIAIILAIAVMIFANVPLSRFIEKNPSVKMLAISFILMVGMVLIADGFHFHVPRPYIYFSIAFSLFVESLNIMVRKKSLKTKS